MNKKDFKNRVYSELSKITKALSNPHRLEIIELLAQGDYSVEQIAVETSLSVANTSQHLQVLKNAQLVDVTRIGNFMHYRLPHTNIFKAWKSIRDLGIERIAAIDKLVDDFRQPKYKIESVSIDELRRRIASGRVTILDVRPETEFNAGHIPNSISIPFDQLKDRLSELPKRNEIIAYCRGPFCVFADEAVAMLIQSGYRAIRLQEGFPDWAVVGLPVKVNHKNNYGRN